LKSNLNALSQAVLDGNDKLVIELAEKALKDGDTATEILDKGLVPGVQALGELFKNGEVYLPEILIAVRAMNRGLDKLKPHLTGVDIHRKGRIVLGTVEGDLHDIGKNLVGMMLSSNGFEVIDLGVDVPANVFVKAVKDNNADIVAMSGLLTTTIVNFPNIIDALKEAGLRSRVKVMVGGAPVSRTYANEIGAEGFAEDCTSAVEEAARLMKLK